MLPSARTQAIAADTDPSILESSGLRSELLDGQTPWPSYTLFRRVCRDGLAAIRPLLASAREQDRGGWNYGPAGVPSYRAYGRSRALYTLKQAVSLRPRRVLEFASGDGALCASLQHLLGSEVTANDLRAEPLDSALRCFKNAASVHVVAGNIFDLDPKQLGLFDVVIACEIIEHVAHAADFLRQIRRFLAPGGKALVSTPNGAYFHNRLPTHSQIRDFEALDAHQFKPDADGHLFLITPQEMRNLSREAGLRVEEMDVWGTPIITGHCGFRIFAGLGMSWPCYQIESAVRYLPEPLRAKLCFAMSAVLGHP